MATRTKVELDHEGMRAFLRSDEMQAAMIRMTEQVRYRVGKGYKRSAYRGKGRVNVSLRASSKQAVRDNKKNNTLLKAIGGMAGD